MIKSPKIIIMEILGFIYKEGGNPGMWCIGVAKDPRRRLFDEHGLHYQNDAWIYRTAESESEALYIQAYFFEFGLGECEKGWQPGARAVCVYRKHTEQFIKTWPRTAQVRRNGHRPRHRLILLPTGIRGAAEEKSKPEEKQATPGQ